MALKSIRRCSIGWCYCLLAGKRIGFGVSKVFRQPEVLLLLTLSSLSCFNSGRKDRPDILLSGGEEGDQPLRGRVLSGSHGGIISTVNNPQGRLSVLSEKVEADYI